MIEAQKPTDIARTEKMPDKVAVAVEAADSLLFQGQIGVLIHSMTKLMGIEKVSVGLILPTKKPRNMRLFLGCLNSIIKHALDERVELDEFIPILANHIQTIQAIGEDEKKP